MNVSLPRPLKRYVDGIVTGGAYGSASEYVREAIREKLERDHEKSALAARLIEGLDSGAPIRVNRRYFDAKKRALISAAQRSPKRSASRKSA